MASDSDTSNPRRRVTFSQLEAMWEFLNSHRELAMGYNKATQAREYSRRMWESVAASLNSQGQGAVKSWKQWSSYWVDYKSKLKRRVAAVRQSQNLTGGGPASVPPLNDIEKKFLSLMGEDYGTGLPNIQVDPLAPQATTSISVTSPNIEDEPNTRAGDVVIWPEEFNHLDILQEEVPPQEVLPQEVPPQEVLPQETVPLPPSLHAPRPSAIRRRRRRETPNITREAARFTLIELSKKRLELQQKNAETMSQILDALNKIADKIDR